MFSCFYSIDMVSYSGWFSNVKSILHSWNKPLLVIKSLEGREGDGMGGGGGWGARRREIVARSGTWAFIFLLLPKCVHMYLCVSILWYSLSFVRIFHNKMYYNKKSNNRLIDLKIKTTRKSFWRNGKWQHLCKKKQNLELMGQRTGTGNRGAHPPRSSVSAGFSAPRGSSRLPREAPEHGR